MHPDNYHLIVVNRKDRIRAFLDFPSALYKSDKNWIKPLDVEIEKIFDPSQNYLFKTGEAIRWLLYDPSDKLVGRMAAFYDKRSAMKNEQPTGGIGFFDCIDNKRAAHALFDAGKKWLAERGMEAMDGPVNFGDRNCFWGCLSDGFHEPVFNMPYNFLYYNQLFESYGFKDYFKQYTYHVALQTEPQFVVARAKTKRLLKDTAYRFETFNWEKYDRYADDFMTIYNKAWASFPGVSRVSEMQAKALLSSLKPIIDKRALIFGYYENDPISFYVMVPDINQIVRKFNGKLNGINKLKFFFQLKVKKKCTRLIGLAFGVVPEFQGKGVEAAMVARFENEIRKKRFRYSDLEMNWIGDFNPTMMKLIAHLGGAVYKTHITYRYLFDRSKEFKRASKFS